MRWGPRAAPGLGVPVAEAICGGRGGRGGRGASLQPSPAAWAAAAALGQGFAVAAGGRAMSAQPVWTSEPALYQGLGLKDVFAQC